MFTEQLAQAALDERSRQHAAAAHAHALHPRRSRPAVIRRVVARLARRGERPVRLVLPTEAGRPRLVPIPVRSTSPRRGS